MPAKTFRCPDGEVIEIEKCLAKGGCRMGQRCATLPFLRAISFDREWRGVSPSAAGNGPRLLYLRATVDYTINPQDRVWAILGTGTHDRLAMERYTGNVLTEEPLSDDEMKGVADVLEEDEDMPGHYVLSDYKVWGSFKIAKALGIYQEEVPIVDGQGNNVLLKTGKNKGQPKTEKVVRVDPDRGDLANEELQLNRYRIFFERLGFPISKIQVQAIPRDGNTYIAQSRGIDQCIYVIPVKRLPDETVLNFYRQLQAEIDEAFATGWIRRCNDQESWEGRRCKDYCEVSGPCAQMDAKRKGVINE